MRSKIISPDQTRSFIETARRAQIIECAIQAIVELGYAQASLAQIAKRATVSTGVISYYFAGKDDLIREVVAHIYAAGEAEVRPQVEGLKNARQSLLAYIAGNAAFSADHRNYLTAMMEILAAARAARTPTPHDQDFAHLRSDPLSRILEWGQQTGEFRRFSVPIMTDTIIKALDMIAQRPATPADEYVQELVTLFDLATRAQPITQGATA